MVATIEKVLTRGLENADLIEREGREEDHVQDLRWSAERNHRGATPGSFQKEERPWVARRIDGKDMTSHHITSYTWVKQQILLSSLLVTNRSELASTVPRRHFPESMYLDGGALGRLSLSISIVLQWSR